MKRACLFSVVLIIFAGCANVQGGRPANVTVAPERPAPLAAPWLYNDDPPQIVGVWLSTDRFTAGDVARVRVTTSTNAASVEARIESYGRGLRKESPGQFGGVFHVPALPPFLRRVYTLRFIARNSLGVATQESVGIELR